MGTIRQQRDAEGREVDDYEATLRRRALRFAMYLRLRAYLGLLLLGAGVIVLGGALVILTAALGWTQIPALARWTRGFDGLLAVFLPAALGFVLVRSGWKFWRHRHIDDDNTGCLVG